MRSAYWHNFQILTKRSERLLELNPRLQWMPNIWMGVSVENSEYKFRVDHLRETAAHVKFLSCEPLLGPLPNINLNGIDWVIVGGESGPGARNIDPAWQDSAEMDFQAMETLFKNGHFVWALFVGHPVVEKLLKAYYVRNVDLDSPQIHNLLKIAEKAKLDLSETQKIFLDEVTTFNIQARYPDFKNRFYRKATRDFTEKYLVKIKEFKEWMVKLINK